MRRSISPVIATVILIAITIIIGAAVAGWLLGLWGGLGDVESLRIYPDTEFKIESQNNNTYQLSLKMNIKNEGTRDARIRKILVEGLKECSMSGGSTSTPTPSPTQIKAGFVGSISCTVSVSGSDTQKVVAGASYLVKVVTESGGVYQTTVILKDK